MKNHIILFMTVSILLTTCTSVHSVKQKPNVFLDEFNKAANGRKGHIILTSSQKIIGQDIQMSQDSTYWIEKTNIGLYT